jgi:succinate-semialdehyde dehydrogenase/glutarate-semialdehyde dehydrogenase
MSSIELKNSSLFKNNQGLVSGKWLSASESLDVVDPGSGQVIGKTGMFSGKHAEEAIQVAHEHFILWRSKTAKERSIVLRKWARLIEENLEDLALLMTREQGKPIAEAIAEVKSSASYFDWFADEARRVYGDVIESNLKNQKLIVQKYPVGVVGIITPVRIFIVCFEFCVDLNFE